MNVGKPQYFSIGLGKSHATNTGIWENQSFSVCIPSADMVVEVDYVGIVSAAKVDKSRVFEAFYGELKNAPMAKECPLCMECRLHQVLDFKTHDIFIGEIVASYAEDDILTDGVVDLAKSCGRWFSTSTPDDIRRWESPSPRPGAWASSARAESSPRSGFITPHIILSRVAHDCGRNLRPRRQKSFAP